MGLLMVKTHQVHVTGEKCNYVYIYMNVYQGFIYTVRGDIQKPPEATSESTKLNHFLGGGAYPQTHP